MASLRSLLPARWRNEGPVIPVIRMQGAIMTGGSMLRNTLSLATVSPLLHKAFADKRAPAVAIAINSPGGSPVQSRLIFRRIRDLAEEKNKEVLVFVEDVAASGGYMIAIAGDTIIADPVSIVGSIGVISAGFGFTELIEKIGVERRVYTSGSNKSVLDPFQPEKPSDVEHLKSLQAQVHQVFIDLVKRRRGTRLADNEDLFTGLFWTGEKARELGLVDEIGDMRGTIKRRYGEKAKMRLIAPSRTLFGRKQPGAFLGGLGAAGPDAVSVRAIAAEGAAGLVEALEERALWARFGR